MIDYEARRERRKVLKNVSEKIIRKDFTWNIQV
jgi:hypothetical protein